MIVFNTTYHVDASVHDEVIKYFKEEFIPQAIHTKLLREPHLFLIHAQHEESGTSYSLQFRAKDLETLEKWMMEEGEQLEKVLISRFGNKACGFMTLLEEVEI